MWQNDENKMESNQGWNIPNRGDERNGAQQQQQQIETDNDKMGLDSFDELLGAIGGRDNSLNFMNAGSNMTSNNSNSDNGNRSFNNNGSNCDDGGNGQHFSNYNYYSGTSFNNNGERSQDRLNKNNEGWPSIGSQRGDNGNNSGNSSSNAIGNNSGWGCVSQQLHQNQQGFQQQQQKKQSNNNNNNIINSNQSNNSGVSLSGWGDPSNVSKAPNNSNWLNENNNSNNNQDANNNSDNNNGGGGGIHRIRENDYSSYGSQQKENSTLTMAVIEGENKPVKSDYIKPALLSDNWGKTVINQDKAWDLPPSPQSSPNESSAVWTNSSTTGTEIWENAVRNKTKASISAASDAATSGAVAGATSANQKSSQPWGHTLSTHIGGTWGEEEDSSNVWTGVPPVGPSPVAMGAGTGTITSILNSAVNANNHSIPSESNSCSDNGTSLWGSSTKANSSGVLATANAVNALNTGGVGNFGGPIANNANMNIVNSSVVGGDIIKQRGDNIMNPMINSSNSSNSNNNNSNINNNSNNINLNNSNNVNMMKSSCSSSTSSGSGSSNIGTWGTLPATSLNKGEVIQPTGWDTEEENAAKRIPPVASGNFDDGTAVWGKPEQHNKIARWKETANAKAGNSANANNAPSSQTNMNSGISNITSPSPGMIRLPPGTSGLNSSNTNIMNNAINDQNKLANGNLMHDGGDISDVSNSGMGGMLNNPNVMGTDIWGKPVTNRNWNDSQSSLNMNNKSNPMPIGGGGGGWGAKQSDSGTPKTPGTPNTPGSNIGGGWGSDGGPTSPHAYWGSKGRNGGGNNWLAGDEPIEAGGNWNKPKQAQQPQQMSKEMLASSKVYRLLMEMGCKKEDIENALRSSGLKKEELNDLARAFSMRDNMNEIDLRGKGSMVSSNTPTSLLLNSGLVNSSLSSIMNRNPSQGMQQAQPQATLSSHQTQDHLANVQQSSSQQHDQSQIHHQLNQAPSQALPSINHVQNVLRNQAAKNIGSGQPTLPSEKQLMHLVQQIQLAVQSGHLNAQILNQPLALPTIHLINQLLQNIKTLQQLQMQIATHSKNGGPLNNSSQSNLHVQITQTKLRISNLQNQINIQQALFLKQQQQQGQMSGGPIHSQANVGMSQGSAANQSPLIYSQTNGDIGGNGGAQNQSQHQIPPNIHSSSHAQGVLHSNLVSSTGNSNPSVPQVFNHNHGGNGNGAGMDFLKDGEAMQLNSDFRDLWCVLKDFGGAQSGMHPIPGLATSMSGTHGIINSMSNSSHQGHHQQQTQQGPHQSQHQQQSRLKSWKFSNFDRDDHSGSGNTNNNDFLRAPGSSKHQQIVESVSNMARNSDNSSIGSGSSLSLVGGGNDSPTWSKDSIMNNVSSSVPSSVMGPNVTQSGDLKGLIMSSSSSASGGVMTASSQSAVNNLDLNNINNLVPEFEPGKPWKGVSGMKIEDDPHITPGSIARSPLSVNTVRDPALIPGLYNNWSTKGANPTTVNSDIMAPAAVGLSSSTTWAFNPNANTGWGAIPNESTNSETLWSGSMTKTRGPPPGLGQERVAPRGNQALAGIRPQSNSYGNWMANPSNDGGDHLANRGLESKDMLFSRMMNNSNGMGFGMGVNIGNKWM